MTTANRPPHAGQVEVDTAEIAARVRMIVGGLNRRLRLQPSGDRLSSTNLATLSTIERCAPLRIGDLAAVEGISAAAMTRVVADLTDLGLIQCRPDPDDGRACQVLLSDHGTTEMNRLRAQRTGYLATRPDQCTPEQRAVLAAALPVLELLAQDTTAQT